jgi:putative NADH-flavin reductase
MRVCIAGATGATGIQVVEQLLERGVSVKAVVRSAEKLHSLSVSYPQLEIVTAGVSEMSDQEMQKLVKDCDAVISCLGHNLSLKGIFGKPRRLVTESMQKLTEAAAKLKGDKKIKFILMNTTGNSNRDLKEKSTLGQNIVVGLLRVLLPPQADNEQAADYLRKKIGQDHPIIEWVAVRPDGLINLDTVTEYSIHPSPTRDPIFNAGKTSRINVAHFMAELLTNRTLWNQWKGQMPVIYNNEDQ